MPQQRKLDKGTLGQLQELIKLLQRETEDANEIFSILRIIEKLRPNSNSLEPIHNDPYRRLKFALDYTKRAKGRLKDTLIGDDLVDPRDVLIDQAQSSGNWREYLSFVQN